ncbi:MAG TPA: MBL fold metallo-hydrolase [Longimicrobium sp.]|nr:MBL fold metallo-hydrolase [Longimicrobium sp.]
MAAPPVAVPALRVTCWGTRGSIPSPGPGTVRYGGNTSCVEVRSVAGERLVLDAGTGIRSLSRQVSENGEPFHAQLFVTHYHWDHIQGFPFLAQLYEPESRLCVHGPRQGEVPIDRAFAGQMSPLYFPIPMDALSAKVQFDCGDGIPWERDGVRVTAFRVNHPGVTFGYRIEAGGASLVYVPDDELGDDPDPAWYARLLEFCGGADLLLHDAMYTDAEYQRYRGWGHSTFRQAVKLAEDAGVRRIELFHHAPDRSDTELDRILHELRADAFNRGSHLQIGLAAEGEEIALGGGGA